MVTAGQDLKRFGTAWVATNRGVVNVTEELNLELIKIGDD